MSEFELEACNKCERLEEVNAQLLSALHTVMTMDLKGHSLADRLQFSITGRAILEKARAAIASAE